MGRDREQLAAQCFVSQLSNLQFATEGIAQWAFDQADVFLAYAERQRKQPEPPKACQCGDTHDPHWKTYDGFCIHCGGRVKAEPAPKRGCKPHVYPGKGMPCVKCGEGEPESIAPKREARPREWAILIDKNGGVLVEQDPSLVGSHMVRVREILP